MRPIPPSRPPAVVGTGGSRVTYASAMVVTQSTERVIGQLRERAAKIWKIDPDAVVWENGEARPAGDNAGKFEPLSLREIAGKAAQTGNDAAVMPDA